MQRAAEPDRPPPRNVLYITCDQWRASALGCAGHPLVQTPALDKLAADGLRFAQHYAQAVQCGPSRACEAAVLSPLRAPFGR